MSFATDIPDADALFEYVIAHCSNPDSPDHGPNHWAHVAETGLRLVSAEPQCDLSVLFLFSLFHDSMRENEFEDPAHGWRAAQFFNLMRRHTTLTALSKSQIMAVTLACAYHTEGDDIEAQEALTIRTCWNADRLNLMRVGIYPEAQYLSGKARDPHVIAYESARVDHPPVSWNALHLAYMLHDLEQL